MHADAKYLKKIPLAIKNGDNFEQILVVVDSLEQSDYMGDDWYEHLERLNLLVYEAYGIGKKEMSFIDNMMKQVQSKRWLKNGRRK